MRFIFRIYNSIIGLGNRKPFVSMGKVRYLTLPKVIVSALGVEFVSSDATLQQTSTSPESCDGMLSRCLQLLDALSIMIYTY